MTLRLRTAAPFTGRIFSLDAPSTCDVRGTGQLTTEATFVYQDVSGRDATGGVTTENLRLVGCVLSVSALVALSLRCTTRGEGTQKAKNFRDCKNRTEGEKVVEDLK